MVARWTLAVGAAAMAASVRPAAAAAGRPHVLLILVDDLGWNNLGFKRERLEGPEQQEMLTPTIDRLVRSGIELVSPAPCSVSARPSLGGSMTDL
jgi:arylsulfatase A-like enzyme